MGYHFPQEHERRITFFPREEAPREEGTAPPPSGTRRKSRPSFAEIDVVEADLARDPRVERE